MMQSNFRKQPLSPLSLGNRKVEFGRKLKEKPSSGDEQTPEECGQGGARPPETGHRASSQSGRQNGKLKSLWLPSAATAGVQNHCWGEANKSDLTRGSKSLHYLQPPSLCLVPTIGRKKPEGQLAKEKWGLQESQVNHHGGKYRRQVWNSDNSLVTSTLLHILQLQYKNNWLVDFLYSLASSALQFKDAIQVCNQSNICMLCCIGALTNTSYAILSKVETLY